ncbi:hypothetical protein [Bacillus sp. REN3]|uniref:hypothetical protein n=1 Tax=Bacillus sp. REN3 TaxID=2802440 RepID=UPI001AED9FD5|nr:hypothetical protein [Bacillus sp. REN3]
MVIDKKSILPASLPNNWTSVFTIGQGILAACGHIWNYCRMITEKKLERAIGDSGFGIEENYSCLDEEEIAAYIKYNTLRICAS